MKNWLSQLFEQMPEKGRNAARLAIIFMVAASLAVLIFAYVAVQSGAWQAYAVMVAFVGFFTMEALVVKFAQRNQVDTAGVLLIVGVCYIVLAMTMLMTGIALGLSIALALVIVEIVFETLSGSLATRARISGFAFAIGIFLMDKFASWNRPSLPAVQYAIPTIAAGTVITIAFLTIARLVTWRNLRLARKLLVAFSALAFLALIVGVVANSGLRQVQRSYESALSQGEAMQTTSLHLSNDLLSARRHEKDFIARWTVEGFDTAYTNYVVTNQQSVAAMRNDVDQLSAFAPTVGQDLSTTYPQAQYESDLATLKESISLYDQNFQKMVQLSKERGFKDTGLEGQFRTDVHNIEDRIIGREGLDPLVITMLTIRRHEKDYLLRGEQTYIDQTHQSVADLKQQIASSDKLASTEKKEMTTLADQYIVSFDALVEKDIEIAAATQAFRDAAHTMEPPVDKITTTGTELSKIDITSAKTSSTRTLLISSGTLALALLVALFLSVALARQITRPVTQLTGAAHELESGNYDAQAEITSGDEIGTLANAFNGMARQIKQTLAAIAQRAAELQTVSEVSASASTVLDVEKLFWNVSDLTKKQFGLYHAHIYMLNEAGDTLVLIAGAGEAGRQMVAEGRSIPLDREQSLVARAARERRGVIVNDVRAAPDFLPHPLLPETRAELAVPMIVSDKVIGVFDVQSDVADRFTQENADIQTIMAAQIAVAVQNARSYASVQARAEREALISSIGQKIQNTTSVESALQVALRELGHTLGAQTSVRLKSVAGHEEHATSMKESAS